MQGSRYVNANLYTPDSRGAGAYYHPQPLDTATHQLPSVHLSTRPSSQRLRLLSGPTTADSRVDRTLPRPRDKLNRSFGTEPQCRVIASDRSLTRLVHSIRRQIRGCIPGAAVAID